MREIPVSPATRTPNRGPAGRVEGHEPTGRGGVTGLARPATPRRTPLCRGGATGGGVSRRVVRVRVRHDRRDAHHAARPVRDSEKRGHGVRPHVPGLQLQMAVGAAGGHRAPAGPRPLRPAALVALAGGRAGDGRRRLPGQHRPQDGSPDGGYRRHPRRRPRGDLRHRDRCLPYRAAGAAPARGRIRHVPVRLAHRQRDCRCPGPGDRRALRVGLGLCRLRALCAAGDAGRRRDGRAGAPPARSSADGRGRGGDRVLQPARRVPAASRRPGRAGFRAHP